MIIITQADRIQESEFRITRKKVPKQGNTCDKRYSSSRDARPCVSINRVVDTLILNSEF
jgi:hypothetical protein